MRVGKKGNLLIPVKNVISLILKVIVLIICNYWLSEDNHSKQRKRYLKI